MRSKLAMGVALVVGVTGCQKPETPAQLATRMQQEGAAARTAFETRAKDWERWTAAGQADSIAGAFVEDGYQLPPHAPPQHGRAAIQAYQVQQASLGQTTVHISVDEVMANTQEWQGKRLQLHGHVVTNSILVKPDTLEYRFKVQNNGKVVDASYQGIVPDTFKDRPGEEAEVVLKGQLTSAGFHVDPNGVMAKCPSKYEAAKKVG